MKRIVSISVDKSNFYQDKFRILFSEKLNCLMGGRGTGKSTIVHFLEACFDPAAEGNKDTYNILKNNLGGGIITLVVQDDDGKKYKITKSIEEGPDVYTLPGEKYTTLKSIQDSVTCDFYKSQSIEEIGRNPLDRLALIDKMLLIEKAEILAQLEEIKIELEENSQAIKAENSRIKQLNNSLSQYDGIEEELKKLQEEKPQDIDTKQHTEFDDADKKEKIRASEKRYIKSVTDRLGDVTERLEEYLEEFPAAHVDKSKDSFINKDLISTIEKEANETLAQIEKHVKDALSLAQRCNAKMGSSIDKLGKQHLLQQNEFTQLKQRIEKDKAFYTKWNALSKKVEEKNGLAESKKKTTDKRDKCKKVRIAAVKRLTLKMQELLELRKNKITVINKLFEDSVKITLTAGGITSEFEDALRNALKGSNMRYNTLIPSIVSNFSPQRFAEIIHNKQEELLKKITGIDKERSAALINALFETDAIYQIELICSPDLPEFHLKVDGQGVNGSKDYSNYKLSDELSTGQRCTTVLPIIFAVSNNPLIIDQPEDNLDNKYITDTIHKMIREQKEKRQLIFITHNPNIPVLADAEANVFLTYADKKSGIDNKGTVNEVKVNILNLMEGGKEAFKRREQLYQDQLG